jgi:hypothetical protein
LDRFGEPGVSIREDLKAIRVADLLARIHVH